MFNRPTSVAITSCPSCESSHVVKNGKVYNGKQIFRCRDCARQFVQDSQNKMIEQATQDLIDKLLLEQIPLAGIARVTFGSQVGIVQVMDAIGTTLTDSC